MAHQQQHAVALLTLPVRDQHSVTIFGGAVSGNGGGFPPAGGCLDINQMPTAQDLDDAMHEVWRMRESSSSLRPKDDAFKR